MQGSGSSPEPVVQHGGPSRTAILVLSALAVAGWLPVLLAHDTVRAVAALAPLANSASAYFVPRHAALLYVATPLVVASGCLLFLSPGLVLSLAFNVRGGPARWLLSGFGLSLVVVSGTTAVMQAALGRPLRGGFFLAVVVACALASIGVLLLRHSLGRPVAWPFHERGAAGTAAAIALPPLVLLVLLTPKFHWENFNGDGVHAFETARLLLSQPLPFWSATVPDFTSFPGATSMLFAFPASWFVRAFGEVEAAARLPYLLYLAVLYAGIVEIARHGRERPGGRSLRWLPWVGLTVYTVVMAYSATYNPYAADLALPAAQDTLMMACYVGFLVYFLEEARPWMALFAVLTVFSLPNGALLIALWLFAVGALWRPVPWRPIVIAAAGVGGGLIAAALAEPVLTWLGLPAPGAEYAGHALLGRLRFLQWEDWTRIAYLVVPSGIVPAIVLSAWRRQDRIARALTFVTLAYFVLFYFQAYIALHHFVPVMLLPLCVFWRVVPTGASRWRSPWVGATVAGGLLALAVSLPRDVTPDLSGRQVGAAIEDRTPGYDEMEPEALRRADILLHCFPYDFDLRVPGESYGGSPHVWLYYAHRDHDAPREINYVLQSPSEPAPANMRRVASERDVVLYLQSDAVWERHVALRPATPAGSRLFVIPREILFRRPPDPDGIRVIDVKRLLGR